MVPGRVLAGTRSLAPLSSISITSLGAARAFSSSITTGAKLKAGGATTGLAIERACRQRKICAGVRPYVRATALTFAPGAMLSATIRALSSALQRRRRPAPVKISTRRAGEVFVLGWSCVSVIVPATRVKGPKTLTSRQPRTGAAKAPLTTKLYSANSLEHLNKEVEHGSDVVGIFPNEASIVRMVGAMLLEQNNEWLSQHCNMEVKVMTKLPQLLDAEPATLPPLAARPMASSDSTPFRRP